MSDTPATPMTFRTVFLTILIPVFAPLSVLLFAIWGASGWIKDQENNIATLKRDLVEVQKVTGKDQSQETRISNLELRLNWLDDEAKRNRIEGIQVNKEIRDNLERLKDAVTRLESTFPLRRHGDLDWLFSPTYAGVCLRPLCTADDITLDLTPSAGQSEHSGDQAGHQGSEAQAR